MALVETIKFEGPQDALVWKNAGKDFYIDASSIEAGSQLIVDEFYEAILFANGNALDLFKPGRHTLITQNLPLLKQQYEKLTTSTPFPCKVYFINKVHQLELKWGTQGAITLDDPKYGIFVHVGCCGTMAIKVADSRKFLLKFVGNKDVFDNKDLIANMRGIISSRVKDYISKMMIHGNVSFFDINANIYDVGLLVKEQLDGIFEDYGIEIQFFNIETIDVPREDYDKLQESKQRQAGRIVEGATWDKEQMVDILKTAAANEGSSGNMMGMGMGLGMGAGLGVPMGQAMGNITNTVFGSANQGANGAMGQMFGNSTAPTAFNQSNKNINVNDFFNNSNNVGANQGGATCASCGAPLVAGAKFCSACGTKVEAKAFCHSCGAEVAPGSAFCSSCGTKLN